MKPIAAIAAHLKKIRPVAVLALSGSTELTAAPKSVDLLLPKPQEPEELLKAVGVPLAQRTTNRHPRKRAEVAGHRTYLPILKCSVQVYF
jgi:hypothetical protein